MTSASAGSPTGQDPERGLIAEGDNIAVGAADAPTPVDLRLAYARIIDPKTFELIEHYATLGAAWGDPRDEEGTFNAYPQLREARDLALAKADAILALKATPLIGLSQGEGDEARARELLIAEVAAEDPAEADRIRNIRPIVANQDMFWQAALRAIVAALSGLSLPGRGAISAAISGWFVTPEADARGNFYVLLCGKRHSGPFDTHEDAYEAKQSAMVEAIVAALSTVQDGSVREEGPWSNDDENALHARAAALLDTAGEEMLRIESNASVWVTRNSALRAIIHLIKPARRSSPQSGDKI